MRLAALALVAFIAYPPGDPEPLIPPDTGCWDPTIPFDDCAPPPTAVPVGRLPATL